jgi:Fis family transcriptional regulator
MLKTNSLLDLKAIQTNQGISLKKAVQQFLSHYFSLLDIEVDPVNLYALFLAEIEVPLLEISLLYTRGNQTRAARMLKLNRVTFRKKIKNYGLLT